MKTFQAGGLNRPETHWNAGRAFLYSLGGAAVCGLAGGVLYALVVSWAEGWLRSLDFSNLRAISIRSRLAVLFPFLAGGVIFGWGMLVIAERIGRVWGWALLLPVGVATAAALGTSILLDRAWIDPWEPVFWWVHAAFGVGALGLPAARLFREE